MKDYYKILEIPFTASNDVIKKAYRTLSKKYHPDINPAGMEQFKNINEANNTLSNPIKRSEYNSKYLQHFKTAQTNANTYNTGTKKPSTQHKTSNVKKNTQNNYNNYQTTSNVHKTNGTNRTNSTITVNGVTINVSGNNTTTNVKVVNGKVIIETFSK
jgi:DnaJ-class molecular chaperone